MTKSQLEQLIERAHNRLHNALLSQASKADVSQMIHAGAVDQVTGWSNLERLAEEMLHYIRQMKSAAVALAGHTHEAQENANIVLSEYQDLSILFLNMQRVMMAKLQSKTDGE